MKHQFMPESLRRVFLSLLGLVLLIGLTACPKTLPKPEIDRAEEAMDKLKAYEDCAPETVQAARTMMERAKALLKEKRYDEAKPLLIGVDKLVAQAKEECDKKHKEEEEAKRLAAEKAALEAARLAEIPEQRTEADAELGTVHFGFNTSELNDESRQVLSGNAEYMTKYKDARIQIEGHCDNRGSTEYNLSLGERRALSVKQYMIKLGVDPIRMEIISFGAERPVESQATEDAWAKNRRAEFMRLK
ncbi:MAG: peptidoglycan-associated lipoprotein Pal [Deltaproteobacteria bacterium]|nr:peptidoglycan-associated lipoprotein Pal [Deltaproteobacteria bacterium]